DYNEAISINPKYALAYSNRGLAHYDAQSFDQAIADYKEAILLNGSQSASAAHEEGNPDRVEVRLAQAYNARGDSWKSKKDFDRAFADYTEALSHNPKLAAAYLNRGNVWLFKNDYDKAIVDYTKAIELDKKLAIAYHERGNAWRAKKDYDKAIAD